jgi:hypothetical protein
VGLLGNALFGLWRLDSVAALVVAAVSSETTAVGSMMIRS